ncbi:MAG: hypothetical protein ACI96G_000682 [Flavobacterium sp.]|jgi:hypothetical protein
MVVAALVFILLGILIKYRKMYFLIAGCTSMPKEEQAKQDIEGIATVFRNTMFGMALLFIIGFFAAKWFKNPIIENESFATPLLIRITYLLI